MAINSDSTVIRSAAILTNANVASDTVICENATQLMLYVDFTKGSLTNAILTFQFSYDGATWYQETSEKTVNGVSTAYPRTHVLTTTGTYRYALPASDFAVRVLAIGTGTVTSSSLALRIKRGVA